MVNNGVRSTWVDFRRDSLDPPGPPKLGAKMILKKSIPIATIFAINFLIDLEHLLDQFLIDFGRDLGWPEDHFVL